MFARFKPSLTYVWASLIVQCLASSRIHLITNPIISRQSCGAWCFMVLTSPFLQQHARNGTVPNCDSSAFIWFFLMRRLRASGFLETVVSDQLVACPLASGINFSEATASRRMFQTCRRLDVLEVGLSFQSANLCLCMRVWVC